MPKLLLVLILCVLFFAVACPPPSASCKQDSDCPPTQRCLQQRCALTDTSESSAETHHDTSDASDASEEISSDTSDASDAIPPENPQEWPIESPEDHENTPDREITTEIRPESVIEPPTEIRPESVIEPPTEIRPEPTPETAPLGSLGTPCQNNTTCTQGQCLDIFGLGQKLCSLPCKKNTECPTQSICQRPKAWEGFCMPACQRSQDCAHYPHTPLCASEGHCWAPKRVGFSCLRKDECATGLDCVDPGGVGEKICTKACTEDPSDPRASCGGNSYCEAHLGPGSPGFCVPLCQKPEDCRSFSAVPHCNFEGHCWRAYLNDFRLCTDSTLCLSGLCKQPKDLHTAICTYECSQDSDCSLRTRCSGASPQSTGLCLPSCTTHADCALYLDLQTCETNGFCR
ncbi:hypothetical protein L6R29_08980 [Myxococcota bacterium]|nr:hypothetical protein [Myxococcota bacterium]